MAKSKDGKFCNGHFITAIVRKLNCVTHDANRDLSHVVRMKSISWKELRASSLLVKVNGEDVLIEEEGEDEEEEGEDEDADAAEGEPEQQEDIPTQHQDAPGYQSFDFSEWSQKLGQIYDSQQRVETRMDGYDQRFDQIGARMDTFDDRQQQMAAHQLYMGDHQRRMESQLESIAYDQAFFRPFMYDWAERETTAQHRSMPQYHGPNIFLPTQQYGGFAYPPPQQDSGVGTSSSGQRPVFPMFGSYTGPNEGDGTPSVFGASDEMQE